MMGKLGVVVAALASIAAYQTGFFETKSPEYVHNSAYFSEDYYTARAHFRKQMKKSSNVNYI